MFDARHDDIGVHKIGRGKEEPLLAQGRTIQKGKRIALAGLGEGNALVPVPGRDNMQGYARALGRKAHQIRSNTHIFSVGGKLLIRFPVRIDAYAHRAQ